MHKGYKTLLLSVNKTAKALTKQLNGTFVNLKRSKCWTNVNKHQINSPVEPDKKPILFLMSVRFSKDVIKVLHLLLFDTSGSDRSLSMLSALKKTAISLQKSLVGLKQTLCLCCCGF